MCGIETTFKKLTTIKKTKKHDCKTQIIQKQREKIVNKKTIISSEFVLLFREIIQYIIETGIERPRSVNN
jgi:hypothetical protein